MKLQRPGRAAAVVGGLVAVGATTMMALVAGTAGAAEPGRCTDNVNVRAEPSATARIISVCERGTEVSVGETRNGFVQLTNLRGWAAEEYVSVNGDAPTSAERRTTPTSTSAASERRSAPTTAPAADSDRRTADAEPTREPRRAAPTEEPADQDEPSPTTAPEAGTGGLLG
ncbi:SH3 domain-containing protein [Pseudonocardia sp. H11422]|uniref:SH3 domain-containing protein n=1 Tax=Pseudonocardia sp. H11422 TaxID=2835866 RepID=UPI001BDD984F|nr:SH3 domain-containing protein [Pseudonocardia sp. H11422]